MNTLTMLSSKRGFRTRIGYDFTTPFSGLAESGEVDAFIVATEECYSPLGKALQFFAEHLGIPEPEITSWANWNRFENERVTLVGLGTRRSTSRLRGVILAPGETCQCYVRFAKPLYGRPYRDFYYNVTYEAIALATKRWGARKLAVSHLSAKGRFCQGIAMCNAEALGHFWDEATEPVIDSFAFVGCCIDLGHLEGIQRLNTEGQTTKHRPIQVVKEERPDGVVLVHLNWAEPGGPGNPAAPSATPEASAKRPLKS
ncbi:MAG: hypothetical protein ACYDH9_23700 [Limisphaerales bacterium]